jgi:hypothetical protein
VRQTQILQNEFKVLILYEYAQTWRVIWTDGREIRKEIPEQRSYEYSVGKVGGRHHAGGPNHRDGKTGVWLGPISNALRVEQRWHRVNHDRLELTVTIDDPKLYTRPWV